MTDYLGLAMKKAQENVANNGGPFGAVIVKDDKVVSIGVNRVTHDKDPTAHAEVMAIRKACKELDTFNLEGCELYTSCEPCPMCLSACYWSHIDKIYRYHSRKDAADIGFDDDFIYQEIPMDPEKRTIPIVAMESEECMACDSFKAWINYQDKIEY